METRHFLLNLRLLKSAHDLSGKNALVLTSKERIILLLAS